MGKLYLRVVTLTLSLTLAGCSLFLNIKSPDLALTDLTLKQITLLNTELLTKIRIDNENDQALNLQGAVLRLYINGDYVGKGLAKISTQIQPYSSAEIELPVSISNFSLASKIEDWVDSTGFSYRLEGSLDLGLLRSVPVSVSDSYQPRN